MMRSSKTLRIAVCSLIFASSPLMMSGCGGGADDGAGAVTPEDDPTTDPASDPVNDPTATE